MRKQVSPSGRGRAAKDGCEDQEGEEEGVLLQLELPGLLILRLLQVLPHADVLVMLVLDLCLHRLQLGVELRGDRRRSEATRCGGEAPVTRPGPRSRRLRLHQSSPGYSKGRPVPPSLGPVPRSLSAAVSLGERSN